MNLSFAKKGFTLVEVVIVSVIFATIMVGIILAINRSYTFLDNTRFSVMATNLAREWVEMMYNLRDTNWRRGSGDKDKYWFNLGHFQGWNLVSGNFWPWVYTLKEVKDSNKNTYMEAESLSLGWTCNNLEDFYSDGFWKGNCEAYRKKAALTFTWEYFYYDYDDKKVKTGAVQDFMDVDWLKFYRIVRVYGIYCKNSNNSNDTSCLAGDPKEVNAAPKEMRFCVKIFYEVMWWKHSTELCGIMTNFME